MAELNLATLKDIQVTGLCKQVSPGQNKDGADSPFRVNRDGALQINSREGLVDQWTRDGRVFIAANPTVGTTLTMSAAGTSLTLTAPSLRYTVQAGCIVVPIQVQVSVTTVTQKKDLFVVCVNDTDTYSSGGGTALMTPRNALVETVKQLRGSSVTNLHHSETAIVEAAMTRTRVLKALRRGFVATDEGFWAPEYNILKGDPMVYLVGPASFLVYVVQETTAAEAEWVMSWAELDAATVP